MAKMSTAPQDGSLIEVFADGEWIEASWSNNAFDGSFSGTPGWAKVPNSQSIVNSLISNPVAWRQIGHYSYPEASPLAGHRLKQPIIVLGLCFGDEAKGATVDYLSREVPDAIAVVRWSGGANAAHNVRHGHLHHTFRQFGSGTFLGLKTYLTDKVVVNLQSLMGEAVELENKGVLNPLSLLTVSADAVVTTPIHIALNRAREILRGMGRHGSCGLGIGETVAHSYAEKNSITEGGKVGNFEISGPTAFGAGILTVGALAKSSTEADRRAVASILIKQMEYAEDIIEKAIEEAPEFADELWVGNPRLIAEELIEIASSLTVLKRIKFESELEKDMSSGTVIFEGSQGLLLDQKWGFHPHTTWAQIEPSALIDWLTMLGHRPYVLGLTRSYMTRHGAGPFPSQLAAPLLEEKLPADDNSWGRWQGSFRSAALDLPLLRYSMDILLNHGIQLDGISVSHLDAIGKEEIPVVISYGGIYSPSGFWNPICDETEAFPTINSGEFLNRFIEEKRALVAPYSKEALLYNIAERLKAPVVLVARGPYRRDRELIAVAELDSISTNGS